MIDEWELPAIERIELLGARRLACLPVPGLDGDLHQDLGADSLTIAITGSLQGDTRRQGLLERLQELHRAGEPVAFVADIVASSRLEEVLVVAFDVVETTEWTDAVRYRIVLRQYVEPPAPPAPVADLAPAELASLEDLAGTLLDGLDLPGLLVGVPTLADPTERLRPALDVVRAAVEGVPAALGGLRAALGLS